jgi:HEAT repeat protein
MRRALATLAAAPLVALAVSAGAQPVLRRQPPPRPVMPLPGPRPVAPPPVPTSNASDDPKDLRQRFGAEKAARLLRSMEPDDRLRGVERASALGTPEALALLVQEADPQVLARSDARFRIALARGLAAQSDQPAARTALLTLLQAPTPRSSPQRSDSDDPLFAARLEMTRRIAALALASSADPRTLEALVTLAASDAAGVTARPTPGAAAALAALVAYPPKGTTTWAKPMTAGMAQLVGLVGDLRAAGALVEAAKSAEVTVRAAAIEALGVLGDGRAGPLAAAALHEGEPAPGVDRSTREEDPRLKVAAASALAALRDPGAAKAVEALLADDATAGDAIVLALEVHSPGIAKGLAARAKAAADRDARSAAVAALGRDTSGEAVEALAALVADPLLRTDAADALARCPAKGAMGAIERIAGTGVDRSALRGASPSAAMRRLAVRAYVVRRVARGETSAAMDTTISELASSSDDRDRAVAVFARVALGQAAPAPSLADKSPRVRRAAAMGALGHLDGPTPGLLLARRAHEDDAPTRVLLGAGFVEGDPDVTSTTSTLRECAHGGDADAPLCSLALAARATDVEVLLASPDATIRAHAARGLARSNDPARSGRLLAAYPYEPDPLVRRALLEGLAALPASTPALANALALAARFDPDADLRWTAARAAAGASASLAAPAAETDIAWLHLIDAAGGPPPEGATGALLRSDGLAVPLVFDADGDALVPGVPAGSARLVLAPRLDAAYAPLK